MYTLVDSGTLSAADDLVNNIWDVPRYKPVTLPTQLTWTEDPYNDTFWRYEFYSLRPTSNLLWAYYATHQQKYLDKLLSILTSFTAYDATNPPLDRTRFGYSHGAAFRAMILVDDYVKLGNSGVLPPALKTALAASIARLGQFMASPRNFQSQYNHGFTEASALLLVAVNFPDVAGASGWRDLAFSRIDQLMEITVGADGVEIERSPFYHFYVFDFALQVEAWAKISNITMPAFFVSRVASMVRYATDIVLPNGQIPLIGSSVQTRPSANADLYEELEETNPEFAFAMTGGAKGAPLTSRADLFSTSGQVILRSPIDPKVPYSDNSQLVLNNGPASTEHSHLDALALTFYAAGIELLPDSGLDTYAASDVFNFFHGTSAHNTIVVDGKDQGPGPVQADLVESGPNWEYSSANASLYVGVTQKRSVLMVGPNVVLVIDNVTANQAHSYQQLWHLFPGAHLTMDGTTAKVASDTDHPVLQISQAQLPQTQSVQTYYGNNTPLQGWYSDAYGKTQPNHVVGYTTQGTSTTYFTLLTVGADAGARASVTGHATATGFAAHICAADTNASISVAQQAAPGEQLAINVSRERCSNGN